MIGRRSLFLGLGAATLLAAPSIVRASSLMPISAPRPLRVRFDFNLPLSANVEIELPNGERKTIRMMPSGILLVDPGTRLVSVEIDCHGSWVPMLPMTVTEL